MLLRRIVAAVCPVLLCVLLCAGMRWMDGWLAASFVSYLVKGLLIGACVALIPAIAGVKYRLTGLTAWLLAGAGLLVLMLAYQYLESIGAVHSALLLTLVTVNPQTVLVESVVLGYMLALCAVCRGR